LLNGAKPEALVDAITGRARLEVGSAPAVLQTIERDAGAVSMV
jgi:hypothetical protein